MNKFKIRSYVQDFILLHKKVLVNCQRYALIKINKLHKMKSKKKQGVSKKRVSTNENGNLYIEFF